MRNLVQFFLGGHPFVHTWDDREMAVIKSKGTVLGEVTSVVCSDSGNTQEVGVIFKHKAGGLQRGLGARQRWSLPTTAKPTRTGDLICMLHGATTPMIIRLREDHFAVIRIAVFPATYKEDEVEPVKVDWEHTMEGSPSAHDILLVWDWRKSAENLTANGEHAALVWAAYRGLENAETGHDGELDKLVVAWNTALIFDDFGEFEKAEEVLRQSVERYRVDREWVSSHMIWGFTKNVERKHFNHMVLWWAARKGHEAVVFVLLCLNGTGIDVKDEAFGQTPLSIAASCGHEATVKLLLQTRGVDLTSKEKRWALTPLSLAVRFGQDTIVDLLLQWKVDINAQDGKDGHTPLSRAAYGGDETTVNRLLAKGTANINAKDQRDGRTPLSWAAKNGHEAIVRLLLATRDAHIETRDIDGRTPLCLAAMHGHESVVKLLLNSKAHVEATDRHQETPLSLASTHNHQGVVKMLQPWLHRPPKPPSSNLLDL
jgi:ankyrin repeat protein